jgi:hypothetical protein
MESIVTIFSSRETLHGVQRGITEVVCLIGFYMSGFEIRSILLIIELNDLHGINVPTRHHALIAESKGRQPRQ